MPAGSATRTRDITPPCLIQAHCSMSRAWQAPAAASSSSGKQAHSSLWPSAGPALAFLQPRPTATEQTRGGAPRAERPLGHSRNVGFNRQVVPGRCEGAGGSQPLCCPGLPSNWAADPPGSQMPKQRRRAKRKEGKANGPSSFPV